MVTMSNLCPNCTIKTDKESCCASLKATIRRLEKAQLTLDIMQQVLVEKGYNVTRTQYGLHTTNQYSHVKYVTYHSDVDDWTIHGEYRPLFEKITKGVS